MANLQEELLALEQNREDIVTAIQDKGGTIADSASLKDIPQAIEALPSGGDTDELWAQFCMGTNTEIHIPEGVTSLRYACFRGMNNATSCTFPTTLHSINYYAFYGCSALTEVVLPDTITRVEECVWQSCTSLKLIDFGIGCTTIGWQSLHQCNNLEVIISRRTTPPTLGTTNLTSTALAAIYVPDASVDAYKAATNWKAKADIIKPLSEYNP